MLLISPHFTYGGKSKNQSPMLQVQGKATMDGEVLVGDLA
jgi:hypothetical protein